MDHKSQVVFLRKHSEYLTRLSTQMSFLLTTAEQTLAEPQSESQADLNGSVEQIADVLRVFSKEADAFCERIKVFLETQPQTNGARSTEETE